MGRKKESFENMLEKLESIVENMDNGVFYTIFHLF